MAISYGRPPIVVIDECQVELPLSFEDNPGTVDGVSDGGVVSTISTNSYNMNKAKLYTIIASIMRDLYFGRRRKPRDLIQQISAFHRQLLDWERSIGHELRPETYLGRSYDSPDADPVLRKLALQAITLQISYDNAQVILFRPLITLDKPLHIDLPLPVSNLDRQAEAELMRDLKRKARNQCWSSAVRTSLIGEHAELLKLLRVSPAAAHAGVHALAAGVILSIIALADPLSDQGQESKRGVARLIKVAKDTGFLAPIWSQLREVLTDLMHVIAGEETQHLINARGDIGFGLKNDMAISPFGEPTVDALPAMPNEASQSAYGTVRSSVLNIAELVGSAQQDLGQGGQGQPSFVPQMALSGEIQEGQTIVRNDSMSYDTVGLADWNLGLPAADQTWMWDNALTYL